MNNKKRKALDKKGGNPYAPKLYRYLLTQDNCDLFHCHTMQRIANTVRRAARKKDIPYVISFHGGMYKVPDAELNAMLEPLKGTFNYGRFFDVFLRNNRFLDDASGIICVGYNEYQAAVKKFPDKKVVYLPNGVDVDKFSNLEAGDFRERYNIKSSSKLLLCVSRIDYQKNQLMLLKLLAELLRKGEDTHLLLIGPVTAENYYREMDQYIGMNRLGDNVTLIKGLKADNPDLVKAYRAADLFILPSVHEPFGIVALEAWAAGLPVIASKVGGLQTLIKDGDNGLLFKSESMNQLMMQYNRLANDPQLRERLLDNSAREVREMYSWERITERLIEFYVGVIEMYRGR